MDRSCGQSEMKCRTGLCQRSFDSMVTGRGKSSRLFYPCILRANAMLVRNWEKRIDALKSTAQHPSPSTDNISQRPSEKVDSMWAYMMTKALLSHNRPSRLAVAHVGPETRRCGGRRLKDFRPTSYASNVAAIGEGTRISTCGR